MDGTSSRKSCIARLSTSQEHSSDSGSVPRPCSRSGPSEEAEEPRGARLRPPRAPLAVRGLERGRRLGRTGGPERRGRGCHPATPPAGKPPASQDPHDGPGGADRRSTGFVPWSAVQTRVGSSRPLTMRVSAGSRLMKTRRPRPMARRPGAQRARPRPRATRTARPRARSGIDRYQESSRVGRSPPTRPAT